MRFRSNQSHKEAHRDSGLYCKYTVYFGNWYYVSGENLWYSKKEFTVEVMFITSSKVICKVVDGWRDKKNKMTEKPMVDGIDNEIIQQDAMEY